MFDFCQNFLIYSIIAGTGIIYFLKTELTFFKLLAFKSKAFKHFKMFKPLWLQSDCTGVSRHDPILQGVARVLTLTCLSLSLSALLPV